MRMTARELTADERRRPALTDVELIDALRYRAAKTNDRNAAAYLRLAADRLDTLAGGGRRVGVPDAR